MNRSANMPSRSKDDLARELSYSEMATDETGMVISKERKMELRKQFGYCISCPHVPILLLEIKRSRFNPLGTTKKPRTVSGECLYGKCIKCHPHSDKSRQNTTNRAADTMKLSSLHSVSSLSLVSVSSWRSFESTNDEISFDEKSYQPQQQNLPVDNYNQHESQIRLRYRAPPSRTLSGQNEPQGLLPRNLPSRSLSYDGHCHHEPRRGQRPKSLQTNRSRSFPVKPSEQLVDSVNNTKTESAQHAIEYKGSLPEESIRSSKFCSSDGSFASRLSNGTLDDVKSKIDKNKATKNIDSLAQCIVLSMEDSGTNYDVLVLCMDTIAKEALDQQYFIQAFVHYGGNKFLAKTIQQYVDDQIMMSPAFTALRILTTESQARDSLVHLNLTVSVVEAMQCNLRSKVIQEHGCAILSNLAFDVVNNKVETVSPAVITSVLQAIQEHPDDESVVSGACFALKNLTYNQDNLRAMGRTDGMMDTLQRVVVTFDNIFEAHEAIENFSISLAEDASLEESIVQTLMENDAFQKGQPESITEIIDTLQRFAWSSLVVTTCFSLLYSLALSSDRHKAKLQSCIDLDQLLSFIEAIRDKDRPHVQTTMSEIVEIYRRPIPTENTV